MTQNAVVIGAGLAGLQTAWFLRQEGLDVTVIDRREGVALETSFANGGLMTPSHAAPWNSPGILGTLLSSIGNESAAIYLKASAIPQYMGWGIHFLRNSTPARFRRTIERNSRLATYSLGQFNALWDDLNLQFEGDRRGTIMLYRSTDGFERAKSANASIAATGVEAAQCSADELVRLEPALGSVGDKLSGGFYYPGDQHGDAHLFCKALADRLTKAGVQLRLGETVTGFESAGDRVTRVITDRASFQADVVVLAAGFWSAELGRRLRLRLPIKPVKGYSVTYDTAGLNDLPKIPVVDDELHVGLTPLGSRIRFVGTAEFSGFSPGINPARVENLRRAALATYPDLASATSKAEPVSTWCGHRPMTPDCLPIVGQCGPSNFYLNTGHGYLGWTTACGTSRAVADQIAGRHPALDLENYGPARF